jgi:hypothetical protein
LLTFLGSLKSYPELSAKSYRRSIYKFENIHYFVSKIARSLKWHLH